MDHAFYHGGNAPDLGWSAHDQDYCRPDREVMEIEENSSVEAITREQEDRIRSAALMRMFDMVLSDFHRDADPASVGRKVLGVAKFCGHKSVDGWSLGELANAGQETKAAVSARIRKHVISLSRRLMALHKQDFSRDRHSAPFLLPPKRVTQTALENKNN